MHMMTCFTVTFGMCENRNGSSVVEYSVISCCDDSCSYDALRSWGGGSRSIN